MTHEHTQTAAAEHPAPRPSGGSRTIIDRARVRAAVAAGRLASVVLRRLLGRGASAGPGLVAEALAPELLDDALSGFPLGVVVVSGSSGKSTTTNMLTHILRAHGLAVFTNDSTANLRQGILSAVLDHSRPNGTLLGDIAVIEVDEAAATQLGDRISPRLTVLTNVSSDQLDRFHSVGVVARHLAGLAGRSERVVANRDDGLVRRIGDAASGRTSWYGTSGEARRRLHGRMGYARTVPVDDALWAHLGTGTRLESLDDGGVARLLVRDSAVSVQLPARGPHYAVDASAAVEAAAELLGDAFSPDLVAAAFTTLRPVFGRGEVVTVEGQQLEFVLVQNIASFQLNLDALALPPERFAIAIGSDVRDPSWLWGVRFDALRRVDIVSGTRAFEMATRLDQADVVVDVVEPDIDVALAGLLRMPAPSIGRKTLFYSADAMRRVRRSSALAVAA